MQLKTQEEATRKQALHLESKSQKRTTKNKHATKCQEVRNATDEDMKKYIYITHDLSKRARKKNKQPREELNRRNEAGEEDLMIKNGRVVKREGAVAAGQNHSHQPLWREGDASAS